jgi:hypothetical protein
MLIRRIITLFTVLLSRLMSTPNVPDKDTGYLGTSISHDWFQTAVGPIEINLKSANSFGWEVYVCDRSSNSLVARPSLFPTLDLAYDRYCYLHKLYSARASHPIHQHITQVAHHV